MFSVNTYLQLVGGSVKGRRGEFVVEFKGRTHVFPGGPVGTYYMYFEKLMADNIDVITPCGPIVGGVISTSDYFDHMQRSSVDGESVLSTIKKVITEAFSQKGEEKIATSFSDLLASPEAYTAAQVVKTSETMYLQAEYPQGALANGVYYFDAREVHRANIRSLVSDIMMETPLWPAAPTSGSCEQVGLDEDGLVSMVAESLSGDRNKDSSLMARAREALAKLGTQANRDRLAGCYPKVTEMEVATFLETAQDNVRAKLGIELTLEDMAKLVHRYQGVYRFDIRRRIVSMHRVG